MRTSDVSGPDCLRSSPALMLLEVETMWRLFTGIF